MGVALKIVSVLLVLGGLWVWISGRSVEQESESTDTIPTASLSASVALVPPPSEGSFDKEGTIIIDLTNGTPGTPYLLYTDYNEQGKPSIRTKRLAFTSQAVCAQKNLPCATDQPSVPVKADEKVRVTGTVRDDTVTVARLERLSS